MNKQFLNEEGLQSVADNVNKRLKTVETMPVNPKDKQIVLYVGESGMVYTQGCIYQFDENEDEWFDITSSGTVDQNFNSDSSNAQSGVAVDEAKAILFNKLFKIDTWESITWQGFTNIIGDNIWTDGDNVYYSNNSDQYVLNKSTSTWEPKTWEGCSDFLGAAVWKVGNNIYLSNPTQSGEENYVLNKATSTWEEKVWYNKQEGYSIWKDFEGTIYNYFRQKLDVATDTWEDLEEFLPNDYADIKDLFFYKNNVYFIYYTKTYLFNHSTRTWSDIFVSWRSLSIVGSYIWTDGINIYYSYNRDSHNTNYILNQRTNEWEDMNWKGNTEYLIGNYIWTDNESIYCSDYYQWSPAHNYQVKLSKTLKTYID